MSEVPDGSAGDERSPAELTAEELRDRRGGRVAATLRRVDAGLHVLAGVTMVALLLWTVVDIVGRAFFDRPLRGTIELTELAVVILVYLGLARTEDRDKHISVDLLYGSLSVGAQLALRVFAGVVAFVVITTMTWRLWIFAGQLDAGGFETGALRLPLYPVALLGVLGSAAFALAIASNLVRSATALLDRRR
jgi:TRAP-type C4-dicarboxylate transport system permease small subunit